MAIANAANTKAKTVADPCAAYNSLKAIWVRCKAVCGGEKNVKDFDNFIGMGNFLIPFSPSMTQEQYDFYKAEAELPGITAQFSKMLVGGLLRKKPSLSLPKEVPEEAHDWIINQFGQDDSSLISFLDEALWEEIRTSRCWVNIDYPMIDNPEVLSKDERKALKPYPVIWDADFVINWSVGKNPVTGKKMLTRIITRGYVEKFTDSNKYHPEQIDTVTVHEIDDNGFYKITIHEKSTPSQEVPVVAGHKVLDPARDNSHFEVVKVIENILVNGERLDFIPAWPLNGSIDGQEPVLSAIVDKEIALYNKVSRRNHLLYGAATYTPIIISDMLDETFEKVVGAGLGSWIKLNQGDDAKILDTPTAALADMDRAIAAGIEEMAKLGIRMLSPETAQSGIALHLRNASQTAQLGSLNSKICSTFQQIIAFMIRWRYNIIVPAHSIKFSMSSDFNALPIGTDWMKLATQWYQDGLIPRSIWLDMLKQNDMLEPTYDDEAGKQEINSDEIILDNTNDNYANQVKGA